MQIETATTSSSEGSELPTPGIVERYRAERERLAREWSERRDAAAYLSGHAAALDAAILGIARRFDLPAPGVAIAAVGGYGRRELFPNSDIDLLVLLSDKAGADRALGERIAGCLAALWELGLTVGAAVRTDTSFSTTSTSLPSSPSSTRGRSSATRC